MTKHAIGIATAAALALGCATAPRPGADPDPATICAEYRDLRCATARECSMDRARGCLVCTCASPAAAQWPAGSLPSGVPPDRRTPQ